MGNLSVPRSALTLLCLEASLLRAASSESRPCTPGTMGVLHNDAVDVVNAVSPLRFSLEVSEPLSEREDWLAAGDVAAPHGMES